MKGYIIKLIRNLETEIIPPLPRLILSHITTYITPLLIQPLPTSSLPWWEGLREGERAHFFTPT